ncbi:hypothetical protein B0H11DRAFT_2194996 [Mycena galericulata]|nr:hypothetical protein B0H11DRAFT_2194996 [Mycena galericulata]
MTTAVSASRFLVLRLPNGPTEEPSFIKEEVNRANDQYPIVTAEEEKSLSELYQQKVQLGEDSTVVQKMITDHIRYMHTMYFQVKEIVERAEQAGVDLSSEIEKAQQNSELDEQDELEASQGIPQELVVDTDLSALEPLQYVVLE